MRTLFILLASALQAVAWSQNWIDSYKDNAVTIKYSKIDYESTSDGIYHERLIFSYSNHTSEDLVLTFDRKIAYNLEELPKSPERTFEIVIPANSALLYGEENKYDKTYYVFSKDLKGTIKKQLSGFEIINVEYK